MGVDIYLTALTAMGADVCRSADTVRSPRLSRALAHPARLSSVAAFHCKRQGISLRGLRQLQQAVRRDFFTAPRHHKFRFVQILLPPGPIPHRPPFTRPQCLK